MAYYEDLSDYVYAPGFARAGTKTVGWLANGHEFPAITPDNEILELLWLYCSISVAAARGWHDCEFCPVGSARYFERNGQRLSLGTAETRVFSRDGRIFAVPTLIYHYVAVHHYGPPAEFLRALREGPRPPSKEYFDALAKLNIEWTKTPSGAPENRILLHAGANPGGRIYLDKIGTLGGIARTGLKLEEGLIVHFYRPVPPVEDYLFFEGTVHFDSEKGQWYTVVDEKTYRRESDISRSKNVHIDRNMIR